MEISPHTHHPPALAEGKSEIDSLTNLCSKADKGQKGTLGLLEFVALAKKAGVDLSQVISKMGNWTPYM